MQMDLGVIRSKDDYDWTLSEIGPYFENQPEPGTLEAVRFDALANLLKIYEDRVYPVEPTAAPSSR